MDQWEFESTNQSDYKNNGDETVAELRWATSKAWGHRAQIVRGDSDELWLDLSSADRYKNYQNYTWQSFNPWIAGFDSSHAKWDELLETLKEQREASLIRPDADGSFPNGGGEYFETFLQPEVGGNSTLSDGALSNGAEQIAVDETVGASIGAQAEVAKPYADTNDTFIGHLEGDYVVRAGIRIKKTLVDKHNKDGHRLAALWIEDIVLGGGSVGWSTPTWIEEKDGVKTVRLDVTSRKWDLFFLGSQGSPTSKKLKGYKDKNDTWVGIIDGDVVVRNGVRLPLKDVELIDKHGHRHFDPTSDFGRIAISEPEKVVPTWQRTYNDGTTGSLLQVRYY